MKTKNAPLEAANVAILLEHIPIGSARQVHSLNVERVEADHYRIDGGPVIDLSDALAQIAAYSGKHSNPAAKEHMRKLESDLRAAEDALGMFKLAADAEERAEFGIKALTLAELVLREADHVEHSGRGTPMYMHSAAYDYADEARKIANYVYPLVRSALEKGSAGFRSNPMYPGYLTANPESAYIQVPNPFQPAVREGLLERMDADSANTFAKKVKWVEKHMPNIDDASAFVAVLVRGEPKSRRRGNPEEILNLQPAKPAKNPAHCYTVYNSKGRAIAHTSTKAEAESVCPRGGRIKKK